MKRLQRQVSYRVRGATLYRGDILELVGECQKNLSKVELSGPTFSYESIDEWLNNSIEPSNRFSVKAYSPYFRFAIEPNYIIVDCFDDDLKIEGLAARCNAKLQSCRRVSARILGHIAVKTFLWILVVCANVSQWILLRMKNPDPWWLICAMTALFVPLFFIFPDTFGAYSKIKVYKNTERGEAGFFRKNARELKINFVPSLASGLLIFFLSLLITWLSFQTSKSPPN